MINQSRGAATPWGDLGRAGQERCADPGPGPYGIERHHLEAVVTNSISEQADPFARDAVGDQGLDVRRVAFSVLRDDDARAPTLLEGRDNPLPVGGNVRPYDHDITMTDAILT